MAPRDDILRFHATTVTSDELTLAFVVDANGEPSTYFDMMLEEQTLPGRVLVRCWWGDGSDARDEVVYALATAQLDSTRFSALFEGPLPMNGGRYAGVEITFDPLTECEAQADAETLVRLVGGLGERLVVDIPGFMAPATVLAIERKRGAPVLALAPRGAWRPGVGAEVALGLTLSNFGGPFAGALSIELGGDALVFLEAVRVEGECSRAHFDRSRAALGHITLAGDFDIDRLTRPDAAPAPSVTFAVIVRALRSGSGLLTMRLTPTPAMCGSRVVVEPLQGK